MPRELDPSKYDDPAPYKSKKWNYNRIKLLNDYTRASLRQQTCQDFTFVTLWHKYYPDDFENRLDNEVQIIIERGFDKEDEKYFDFQEWKKDKTVKKTMDFAFQIKQKTKHFHEDRTLVTNLDSDDCLHYRYVERVQNLQQGKEAPYFLDVPIRCTYNINDGRTGKKTTYRASPMTTSIEEDYECYPLKCHHTFIPDYIRGETNASLKALQTISGNNIFQRGVGDKIDVNLKEYF